MKNNNWHTHYQKPNPENWYGRSDSLPRERYFQIVECCDLTTQLPAKPQSFAVLGFACDEGVSRNMAPRGAKEGPQGFRQTFTHLASHLDEDSVVYDCGNIVCDNDDLESAQASLSQVVALLLRHQLQPIVIGGGHEISWGHYQGITDAFPQSNIGIINFDAHFDLRPTLTDNKGTSGTSFLQIARFCHQQQLAFGYHVIGIQPSANTRSLYQKAAELGTIVTPAAEIHNPLTMPQSIKRLQQFIDQYDQLYLTICLDVFNSHFAPGVSGPQINGLLPNQVLPLLKLVVASNKVVSFDIAELAPPLDIANKTSHLCASMVDHYICYHFDSLHHQQYKSHENMT